jgi:hypothetical protein
MLIKILRSTKLSKIFLLLLSSSLILNKYLEHSNKLANIPSLYSNLGILSRFFCLTCIVLILLSLLATQFNNERVIQRYFIGSCLFLGLYLSKAIIFKNLHLNSVFIQQEFILLIFFLIFLCSWLPFTYSSQLSFWKFNNVIFIKTIKTIVFSTSVFLTLALTAFLLDIFNIITISILYYRVLIILTFVTFGGYYFITQLPKSFETTNNQSPYPTFYRIFACFYLSPLSISFLIAHYAYISYCLSNGVWPKAQISVLVALSSLTFFLLACQLEMFRENKHSKVYKSKGTLYILTLVLNVFYSIRLANYLKNSALTEFWILIALILCWSCVTCLYFILSKNRDLRFFPISISLITLLLLIPNFSPFYLATHSHVYQFKAILNQHGMLNQNGQFIFNTSTRLTAHTSKSLLDSIYFLERKKSLHLLANLYPYSIAKENLTLKRVLLDFNLSSY